MPHPLLSNHRSCYINNPQLLKFILFNCIPTIITIIQKKQHLESYGYRKLNLKINFNLWTDFYCKDKVMNRGLFSKYPHIHYQDNILRSRWDGDLNSTRRKRSHKNYCMLKKQRFSRNFLKGRWQVMESPRHLGPRGSCKEHNSFTLKHPRFKCQETPLVT